MSNNERLELAKRVQARIQENTLHHLLLIKREKIEKQFFEQKTYERV